MEDLFLHEVIKDNDIDKTDKYCRQWKINSSISFTPYQHSMGYLKLKHTLDCRNNTISGEGLIP